MSNDTLRADQIAFHFYTKLFYTVNQARATEDPASAQKVDKWFNLETPDSDLFTKEEREPYRTISLAPFPGPPTLEIDVLLSVPELTNNQVLVYMPPDSSRVRIEPTPKFILLETWSLGMTFHRPGSASDQHRDTSPDVALPIIYKHGIILFRSVYSLLRVLPVWKFYKRLKRKISGFNRKGNLGIRLRVRTHGESETDAHILGFNARLSPTYRTPLPTSRHDFQAVPHLLGSFTLSTTYLTTPNFQLDELESILSSKFLSLDLEGFVPTLDKNRQRESMSGSSLPNSSGIRSVLSRSPPRAIGRVSSGNGGTGAGTDNFNNFNIADRFILPSRIPSIGAPSLGMTASSGTSALIPPPRPFPTMNPPPNTSPLIIANSPFSIPSSQPIPASGHGHVVNRLRNESLNSSSSSSISARDRDAPQGQGQFSTTNNAGTSSLSTSPVSGAMPIRRPTINPVHPFKSSTFSSTSGSSPSLSIRQGAGGGGGGGVHGGAASPVGVPSSLSGAGTGTGTGVGPVPPASPGPHSSHSTHSRHPSISSASPIGTTGRGGFPPPSPMSGAGGFGSHPSPPSSAGGGGTNVFSPSSLGDRRPRTSGSGASASSDRDRDRDRDRRVSVGSGGGGGDEVVEGGRVPMPMPMNMPPRKRYSSSFGHRYVGSGGSATGLGLGVQVGSANSGVSGGGAGNDGNLTSAGGGGGGSTPGSGNGSGSGRNTPASLGLGPGLEGKKEGTPSFLGEGTTDDDEISIFVQDIDSRKPLSGRAKEREELKQQQQQRERERESTWKYDQRAHGHEPQQRSSSEDNVKGKGKEKEQQDDAMQFDDWHQPLSARRRFGDDVLFERDAVYATATATATTTTTTTMTTATTSPPTHGSIPVVERQPEAEQERERAAQMSISPTRGPMLTSQNEVEERLKKMNEAFFKSLEGLSGGSMRRKDRQKEKEKDKEKEVPSVTVAITTTPSSASGSGSGSGSGGTGSTGEGHNNASGGTVGYGRGLGLGFPSRGGTGGGGGGSDPSRMDYPSYLYNAQRGRYSSTSSSEIGASQGSEEVIGRLELYDEPSHRRTRRKGEL